MEADIVFCENCFLTIIDGDSNGVVEAIGVRDKPTHPFVCVKLFATDLSLKDCNWMHVLVFAVWMSLFFLGVW